MGVWVGVGGDGGGGGVWRGATATATAAAVLGVWLCVFVRARAWMRACVPCNESELTNHDPATPPGVTRLAQQSNPRPRHHARTPAELAGSDVRTAKPRPCGAATYQPTQPRTTFKQYIKYRATLCRPCDPHPKTPLTLIPGLNQGWILFSHRVFSHRVTVPATSV